MSDDKTRTTDSRYLLCISKQNGRIILFEYQSVARLDADIQQVLHINCGMNVSVTGRGLGSLIHSGKDMHAMVYPLLFDGVNVHSYRPAGVTASPEI